LSRLEKNRKIQIEKAIIIGSTARGDFLANSDIDLIIISPDFSNVEFFDRLRLLRKEWKNLKVELEVIGYTPKEFKEAMMMNTAIREAVKEGIQIKIRK
jgi:hypothetical protein